MMKSRRVRGREFCNRSLTKVGPVLSLLVAMGIFPFNEAGGYVRSLKWRYTCALTCLTPAFFVLPGLVYYFDSSVYPTNERDLVLLLTDFIRVFLRTTAMWAVYLAVNDNKDEFQAIWISCRGLKVSKIYRKQLIVTFVVNCVVALRWALVELLLFHDSYSQLCNNVFETLMASSSLILALLTVFYCAVLRALTLKYRQYVKDLEFADGNCVEHFIDSVNLMSVVNKLCGYHTLFVVPGHIFDLLQNSLSFFSFICILPSLGCYDLYSLAVNVIEIFCTMSIMIVHVFECMSTQAKSPHGGGVGDHPCLDVIGWIERELRRFNVCTCAHGSTDDTHGLFERRLDDRAYQKWGKRVTEPATTEGLAVGTQLYRTRNYPRTMQFHRNWTFNR